MIGSDKEHAPQSGYGLLIHQDFLQGYPIAKKIRQYGFFSYSPHEALHLSEQEKAVKLSINKNIQQELNRRIDDFSYDVIIAQIELLLTYANRFYKRQFITRRSVATVYCQSWNSCWTVVSEMNICWLTGYRRFSSWLSSLTIYRII
jgi:hypothetical protein